MIEAALAHVVANRVEAAYARSGLFERRRVLMDDWAGYLAQGIGFPSRSSKATSPGAGQGESQARSPAAVKVRLTRRNFIRNQQGTIRIRC